MAVAVRREMHSAWQRPRGRRGKVVVRSICALLAMANKLFAYVNPRPTVYQSLRVTRTASLPVVACL